MIDFCWGCLGRMAQSGVAVSDELLGLVCRAHLGRTVRNSVGTLLGGLHGHITPVLIWLDSLH